MTPQRQLRAPNDAISHRVGVLLVRIAFAADAVLELHPAALLDHVGGLVRRGVQVRRLAERDVVPGRERLGAELVGGLGCATTDVRARAAHVVTAERPSDRLGVRQCLRGPATPPAAILVRISALPDGTRPELSD